MFWVWKLKHIVSRGNAGKSMTASGSRSYDKRPMKVSGAELSELLHLAIGGIHKTVKPQVIFGLIDFPKQTPFEFFISHQIDLAFEHGFLDALTHAFAHLCDAA